MKLEELMTLEDVPVIFGRHLIGGVGSGGYQSGTLSMDHTYVDPF